nr:hypothetical protein BCV09_18125 [Vibrio cyclitrophicus]PMH17154.1 hypothetical protein BCU73_07635 [Vibrio cyclitrophicus]
MFMNKFSIIIPMFNSEKIISNTIKSITSQGYSNYEVILVDDGSTDASLSICRDLESSNKNLKVFSQENSGPNVARNLGLSHSSGDYIVFLDSDDMLANDALHNLNMVINSSSEVDYFNCAVSFYYDNGKSHQLNFNEQILCGDAILEESFLGDSLKGVCWNKCISRDFLNEKNIRFQPDKLHGRDILFSRLCAYHASKVLVSNICIVNSHVREGSFSRSFSLKNLDSALDLIYQHEVYFKNKVPEIFLESFIHKHLSYILILAVFRCDSVSQFSEYHSVISERLRGNKFSKISLNLTIKSFVFWFILNFKSSSWYIARFASSLGIKPY